jgi:hypothetical protein
MANIVFKLNHVPDEEADKIRELLDENQIDFYETDAGRWGVSVAALWVKDEDQFEHARQIINTFQVEHSKAMRSQYKDDLKAGRVPTFWQLLRSNPVMFTTYWILIAVVLFISVVPIYRFFNH